MLSDGIVRALGALLAGLLVASGATADLLFNEALSAPTTDWDGNGEIHFRSDEWIEIVNTGPGVENLDGVYFRDGTGDSYHFGFSGALAPGAMRPGNVNVIGMR